MPELGFIAPRFDSSTGSVGTTRRWHRRRSVIRNLLLLVAFALVPAVSAQQQPMPYKPMPTPTWITPSSMAGTARVVDGDTVDIAAQRIRLYGIGTLELNQTCSDGWGGADAMRHLEDLIGHQP